MLPAMKRAVAVGACAGCLVLVPAAALGSAVTPSAHYTYRVVRVTTPTQPHAVAREVDGVTTSGTIVGDLDGPGLGSRAFIKPRRGKTVFLKVKSFPATLIDAASADGTVVFTAYQPRGRQERTFLRSPSGAVRRIMLPGSEPTGDVVTGVNNVGAIVAVGFTANGSSRSWVKRHSHFTTFHLRVKGRSRLAYVEGINDHGTIVGGYKDRAGVIHGFIDRHGQVQVVNLPMAGTGGGSQVQDISDNGKWVGAATTEDGDSIDYVHLPGRRLAEIRFPRAGMTTLSAAINDAGEIGGMFTNDQQSPTAFIAKPLPARS
jgi:hypothetical protein